jgi:ectoine hydroxylase-related dioxygenase (phytanoyl-CoA dioxygenase family)
MLEAVSLTPQQIELYRREGYLTLPTITTPQEVAWLRGIYDRLFDQRAGRERGDQFDLGGTDDEGKPAVLPQILMPVRYAPELANGLFRTNALAIAQQLIGPECVPQGEHAILKPAGIGAPTPWHQDEAYWNSEMEYNALSIWIPLQDATLENGCMNFVPRSHLGEIVPHHTIGHDARVHGLEIDEGVADLTGAVACPIPAGGCTIHHNRTLHYAGPNRTSEPRRAYILAFGTPPRKRAVGRDFYWNRTKQTPREQRAQAAAQQKSQTSSL